LWNKHENPNHQIFGVGLHCPYVGNAEQDVNKVLTHTFDFKLIKRTTKVVKRFDISKFIFVELSTILSTMISGCKG
jgi:hypothetical protein